jgi:hypothetical protein
MKRRYMAHRRAYYPRLLPVIVPAMIVTFVIATILAANVAIDVLIGTGIGALAFETRLIIWRRRNPVITPDEYVQDRRDVAMWN